MSGDHLYLIDGSGFIFRAFHALPPLTRGDGTPINAVLGFCNMLYKILEDMKGEDAPSHVAVIFDAARKTFRNEIYEDYKAQRPEPPEELIPQFALIREAVEAFNLPAIEMQGYEADDIIATYAAQARAEKMAVTIVSSDKDLMQLVDDEVELFDSMKNRVIDIEAVEEKFGVGPDKVIDVQALMGDSSDNVPGVPGIGQKTAAELIRQYGDLETLLSRTDEIKQPKRRENLEEQAELARISRQLVTLKNDVPVDYPLDKLKLTHFDVPTVVEFLDEQEFKSLKAKVLAHHADGEHVEDNNGDLAEIAPEKTDYQCIQDEKALAAWIETIEEAGTVAVDTETTSLNASQADLVGISLSVSAGSACYIPLGHTAEGGADSLDFEGSKPKQLPLEETLARLKPVLESPAILKVGQNIKYDLLVLKRYGIEMAPVDDTMLMSYVLDAGLHGHGMDELSEYHLGHKPISFKEVCGSGRKQITFDRCPIDKATGYAAEDADITGRLFRLLKPELPRNGMLTVYETLERPLVPVLVEMEHAGIKVDPKILAGLSADFEKRIEAFESEIYKLAGREFTIGSPKQLGEILFDEMGIEGGKKGKSGAYSTGADILEGLAAQGHELPARVLDWRQLAKLKSTYTDTLQKDIHPDTGRVHTSYSLASTTTGRLASSEPNLQNIPIRTEEGRKIRTAFVAEKGHKLVSADYSQIELRLLAHVAEINELRKAFANDIDIHALTASEVFEVPIDGMDPAVRRQAKAINFGIIYGISPFGLANQLGITQGEAKAYIDAYFERFPGIQDYMERTKQQARKSGYVETVFGRRIHTPGIKDKNPARRNFAERAAINAPLQGSAADIIRRAMIRIPPALAEAGLSAKMLLQVHDELIFEVPEAEVDDTIALVTKLMEQAPGPAVALDVKLDVDAGAGESWDEAH